MLLSKSIRVQNNAQLLNKSRHILWYVQQQKISTFKYQTKSRASEDIYAAL